MRIIAGKYKGRKLVAPKLARPTLDRVRENLFNIIQFRVSGAKVLDLFAGSGALGIEAMSRGAEATFVDNSKDAVNVIKDNLKELNTEANVLLMDYKYALDYLNDSFDIIFLDPPYDNEYWEDILCRINDKNLLRNDGIVIFEHSSEKALKNIPNSYIIIDSRKYGTVTLSILGKK